MLQFFTLRTRRSQRKALLGALDAMDTVAELTRSYISTGLPPGAQVKAIDLLKLLNRERESAIMAVAGLSEGFSVIAMRPRVILHLNIAYSTYAAFQALTIECERETAAIDAEAQQIKTIMSALDI